MNSKNKKGRQNDGSLCWKKSTAHRLGIQAGLRDCFDNKNILVECFYKVLTITGFAFFYTMFPQNANGAFIALCGSENELRRDSLFCTTETQIIIFHIFVPPWCFSAYIISQSYITFKFRLKEESKNSY